MKTGIKILALILFALLLSGKNIFSQWLPTNGLPNTLAVWNFYIDGNNIYAAVGHVSNTYPGAVYRSTDNGYNWSSVFGGNSVYTVTKMGTNLIAGVSGSGSIYSAFYSTNNGSNWFGCEGIMHYTSISVYSFLKNNNKIYCGTNVWFCSSLDSGKTWDTTANFYQQGSQVWVLKENSGKIFAGTTSHGIYISTDGGNTFYQTQVNNKDIRSIGGNGNLVIAGTYSNGVYLSTNNGVNWGQTNLNTHIVRAAGVIGSYLIAGTDTNGLYISSNNGTNWVQKNEGLPSGICIYSFCIFNNYLFAGTQNYGVYIRSIPELTGTYYTISGQIRFQDNNQPVSAGCVKALRYDRNTHQIATVDSTSIQPNGNYGLIHIPPQDSIYIMAFENDEAQLVFVPTYYPSTTNWQNAMVLYPTGNLSNIDVLVYRINNTGGPYHIGGHVYANSGNPLLGLNNSIVYAKVGSDYKSYSISNAAGLYRIDSLASSNYTLTADRIGYSPLSRTVQLSTYSKDSIDITFNLLEIRQNGKEVPKVYILNNNYPNPFNPVTKISFGILQASITRLVIYDILGREIATLINEKLEAGSYNIEWNAANCSSGIYFYRLESADFSQTKKMVLIK